MKTLLELRDEEINARAKHNSEDDYQPRMFIAMNFDNAPIVFNGWFLDPCMNVVRLKDIPDKCCHFSDVELSKYQADFV